MQALPPWFLLRFTVVGKRGGCHVTVHVHVTATKGACYCQSLADHMTTLLLARATGYTRRIGTCLSQLFDRYIRTLHVHTIDIQTDAVPLHTVTWSKTEKPPTIK